MGEEAEEGKEGWELGAGLRGTLANGDTSFRLAGRLISMPLGRIMSTELLSNVLEIAAKYFWAVLGPPWRFVWRFFLCPLKKLAFPVKDLRTGVKQSRMRYYLVSFRFPSGHSPIAYQEVDSNGRVKRYVDHQGNRFIPERIHQCFLIADGKFQFPEWRKIDWEDIFNGDNNSGCWGISER